MFEVIHVATYRIAGNFRGQNICGSAILRHFVGNIFVVGLQVKVGKVASFVGEIFVVRPPTTKTTNILPHENYTLYGITKHQANIITAYSPSFPHKYAILFWYVNALVAPTVA